MIEYYMIEKARISKGRLPIVIRKICSEKGDPDYAKYEAWNIKKRSNGWQDSVLAMDAFWGENDDFESTTKEEALATIAKYAE